MSELTKKTGNVKFKRHFRDIDLWSDIPEEKWTDWRWQYRNRITSVEKLSRVIELSGEKRSEIEKVLESSKMAITPHYATLIDPNDANDPIRRQSVPTKGELSTFPYEDVDSIMERDYLHKGSVIHRYPNKVAFLANETCPSLCRHCTRRRLLVAEADKVEARPGNIEGLLEYLRDHEEVRDVLVTGGDAFSYPNEKLKKLLEKLYSIPHIEMVRLGTRYPVTLPYRIGEELVDVLSNFSPLYVMVQVNHPREITSEFEAVCEKLAEAGIVLGNQAVLLRGVNDDSNLQKRMSELLLKNRVWPYYLYQCDLSAGMHHFRTSIETGLKIIDKMIGHTSGPAVPTYIVEAPGGGGKVPLHPSTLFRPESDNKSILKNFEGDFYEYIEPEKYR